MNAYLNFIYEVLKQFFVSLFNIFKYGFTSLIDAFNVVYYIRLFDYYKDDFTPFAFVLAILSLLLMVFVLVIVIYLLYLLVRKVIRITKNSLNSERLVTEIGKLNSEVIKLSKEKDRLLQLSLDTGEIDSDSRFYKLSIIDKKYQNYELEENYFNNAITLKELCEEFRNYACLSLGLFYDIKTIRLFISGLSSSKLLILQGISGTGKTSLPYAFGKFIENSTYIASVQPSWRDKHELIGYFNEFTKKFNESEILKVLYEASFTNKIYIIVLDEMNIARVEYYFAEMLSVLEMNNLDDRVIEVTSDSWDTDPIHLNKGKLLVKDNVWFVGTANNDESTFAISDKVYDRAIVMNINSKGRKFTVNNATNIHISYDYLMKLFEDSKSRYVLTKDDISKLDKIDEFLINKFQVSFGNRIITQLQTFIPIYCACGGMEIEAIDFFFATKILVKLEQVNLAFFKKELDDLIKLINTTYGKDTMKDSIEYLKQLKARK